MKLDRMASVFGMMWGMGFGAVGVGAWTGRPGVKWVGVGLMAPFWGYLGMMVVLSVRAFVRAVRRGER